MSVLVGVCPTARTEVGGVSGGDGTDVVRESSGPSLYPPADPLLPITSRRVDPVLRSTRLPGPGATGFTHFAFTDFHGEPCRLFVRGLSRKESRPLYSLPVDDRLVFLASGNLS